MNISTLIGLIACFLTTGAFLPQIIKTIKIKDTKSISISMYLIYSLGIIIWLLYGFMVNDMIIIIGNIFSLIFGLIMLVMKIKYK